MSDPKDTQAQAEADGTIIWEAGVVEIIRRKFEDAHCLKLPMGKGLLADIVAKIHPSLKALLDEQRENRKHRCEQAIGRATVRAKKAEARIRELEAEVRRLQVALRGAKDKADAIFCNSDAALSPVSSPVPVYRGWDWGAGDSMSVPAEPSPAPRHHWLSGHCLACRILRNASTEDTRCHAPREEMGCDCHDTKHEPCHVCEKTPCVACAPAPSEPAEHAWEKFADRCRRCGLSHAEAALVTPECCDGALVGGNKSAVPGEEPK